jgi:hypothetical protein
MNTATRLSGLALTLPLTLFVCGATACSSSATSPDPDAPSLGCQRTLCDFEHESGQSDDALTACRSTYDNTICVDDIGQPAPDGTPCNDTASRVSCQCAAENDAACEAAIYAANPACKQCDEGWVPACVSGACLSANSVMQTCLSFYGCTSPNDCAQCGGPVGGWQQCIYAAQSDPNDPGGCNSGSHACWTQPACNAGGTNGS